MLVLCLHCYCSANRFSIYVYRAYQVHKQISVSSDLNILRESVLTNKYKITSLSKPKRVMTLTENRLITWLDIKWELWSTWRQRKGRMMFRQVLETYSFSGHFISAGQCQHNLHLTAAAWLFNGSPGVKLACLQSRPVTESDGFIKRSVEPVELVK